MKSIRKLMMVVLLLTMGATSAFAQISETLSNDGCTLTYSVSGARLVKKDKSHPFEHYYTCEISPGSTISVSAKCNDKITKNEYNVECKPYIQSYFKVTSGSKVLKDVSYTSAQMKKSISFSYKVPNDADDITLTIARPHCAPRCPYVKVTYKVVKRKSNTSTNSTKTKDSDHKGLVFQSTGKDKLYYKILSDNNSVEVTRRVQRIAEGEIEIPPYVTRNNKKYKVTRIGVGAFARLQRLTKVIVPETVTEIADSAFMLCPNLKSVYVKGGLKSFGAYVTAYSPKLEVFQIKKPGTIVSTGNYVYDKSSSRVLTGWGKSKVTITGDDVVITNGAFAGSNVSQVALKSCNIKQHAFLHCSNLRFIDIAGKYTINTHAFEYCHNLKEVRVKKSYYKKMSFVGTPAQIVYYKN